MSYSTLDRYGGFTNKYVYGRGGGPGAGQGSGVWWPDFGPGQRDFSAQDRSHPAETIFENVVAPGKWSTKVRCAPSQPLEAVQMRHPAPAREAMLEVKPSLEAKLAAHEVTERQCALRRAELRQRRMDSWLGEAPISSSEGRTRSRSETSLGAGTQVSREIYEKHGFLVGRSKGQIADGHTGVLMRRQHTPLSLRTMMISSESLAQPSASTSSSQRPSLRKYEKQWLSTPGKSFIFDPTTFLPVPRGGWDSQPPTSWPEVQAMGRREFTAPAAFERSSEPAGLIFSSSANALPAIG